MVIFHAALYLIPFFSAKFLVDRIPKRGACNKANMDMEREIVISQC
jgi:hypothetical protein